MINGLAAFGARAATGDRTVQYVITIVGYQNKIDAIRAVRMTNHATLSLGEAKRLVESHPVDFPAIFDVVSVEDMRAHFRAAGVEISVRQVDDAPRYTVRMLSWDGRKPIEDVYHVFSDSLDTGGQILAKLPYNIPCSGFPLQVALDVLNRLRDVGITGRIVEVEQ
jgi:ribosomal protein L7/L12